MATVYKVEFTITSPWTNFPPEEIKKFIEQSIADAIEESEDEDLQLLEEYEVNVTRIA